MRGWQDAASKKKIDNLVESDSVFPDLPHKRAAWQAEQVSQRALQLGGCNLDFSSTNTAGNPDWEAVLIQGALHSGVGMACSASTTASFVGALSAEPLRPPMRTGQELQA